VREYAPCPAKNVLVTVSAPETVGSRVPLATLRKRQRQRIKRSSQLVPADLKAFGLADGVLRLDLRRQNGKTRSFWIELSSLRVVRLNVPVGAAIPMDPSV